MVGKQAEREVIFVAMARLRERLGRSFARYWPVNGRGVYFGGADPDYFYCV